jgi:hypothetical protein
LSEEEEEQEHVQKRIRTDISYPLVIGLDPGTRKLGFTEIHMVRRTTTLRRINLHTLLSALPTDIKEAEEPSKQPKRKTTKTKKKKKRTKKKGSLSLFNIGEAVSRFLSLNESIFAQTAVVCMEAQIMPKTDFLVRVCSACLHTGIQTRFPHIHFVQFRPQECRSYFDTQGSTYEERKQKSVDYATKHILKLDSLREFKRTFTNPKGLFDVDAVEACLYAVYAAREIYLQMLPILTSKYPRLSVQPSTPIADSWKTLYSRTSCTEYTCELRRGVIPRLFSPAA